MATGLPDRGFNLEKWLVNNGFWFRAGSSTPMNKRIGGGANQTTKIYVPYL